MVDGRSREAGADRFERRNAAQVQRRAADRADVRLQRLLRQEVAHRTSVPRVRGTRLARRICGLRMLARTAHVANFMIAAGRMDWPGVVPIRGPMVVHRGQQQSVDQRQAGQRQRDAAKTRGFHHQLGFQERYRLPSSDARTERQRRVANE